MDSNYESNQLLILTNDPVNSPSWIYDAGTGQWSPTGGDAPIYFSDESQLCVSAERNEAIYINSFEKIQSEENKTHIYDFDSNTWRDTTSPQIPASMVSYDIVYLSVIGEHILLGGINFDGTQNNDIWFFYPDTEVWTQIYRELPLLTFVNTAKIYYR